MRAARNVAGTLLQRTGTGGLGMRVDPELVRSLHREVGDRLQREQVSDRGTAAIGR